MASSSFGRTVRGLRDLKIVNLAGTLVEDMYGGQRLVFTPVINSAEQRGDDIVIARMAWVESGTAQLTAGALSNAAVAIMFGDSVAIAGSSPTATATFQIDAGQILPYFKVYGQAMGPQGDDVHILLPKCQLTGGGEISFADGEWWSPAFEVACIDDGVNGIWKQIQHETATALPTS